MSTGTESRTRIFVVPLAFAACLAAGAVSGSVAARFLAPEPAEAARKSPECERDRCRRGRCVDAGTAETSCSAIEVGRCVTLPCGEAGTIPVLVTFPTEESSEQLIARGRPAMRALLDRTESADPYAHRHLALETLAGMVRLARQGTGGAARPLADEDRDRLRAAAFLYVGGDSPEPLEPADHTLVMMRAIDLALELGDADLRDTVRVLASNADEVRARVGDDRNYPGRLYRRVAQHARARLRGTEPPR